MFIKDLWEAFKIVRTCGDSYYNHRKRDEQIEYIVESYTKNEDTLKVLVENIDRLDKTIELLSNRVDANRLSRLEAMDSLKKEFVEEMKKTNSALDLLKYGVQQELRASLISRRDALVRQKWASYADKRDYQKMYKAYEGLGENGIAEEHYNEVIALPEQEEELQ